MCLQSARQLYGTTLADDCDVTDIVGIIKPSYLFLFFLFSFFFFLFSFFFFVVVVVVLFLFLFLFCFFFFSFLFFGRKIPLFISFSFPGSSTHF